MTPIDFHFKRRTRTAPASEPPVRGGQGRSGAATSGDAIASAITLLLVLVALALVIGGAL